MSDQAWPENAWPTPEQYLDWLLSREREKQVSQIESRLLEAERAHRCVMRNHDGMEAEIKWLREQVAHGVMLRNRLRDLLPQVEGTALADLLRIIITNNPTPADQGAGEQQEAS